MTIETETRPTPRRPLRHWALAMSAPIAWSCAFAFWISLTVPVCSERSGPRLLLVATVTLIATAIPAIAGARSLKEGGAVADERPVERFLLAFALGAGLLFMLVVALSAVPVFLVKACP